MILENEPIRVLLTKSDSETGKLLSDAEFTVYQKDDTDQPVYTGVTDKNGEIEIYELAIGDYIFEEKDVRNEPRWKECIQYAISKDDPIDIVYPQFCVIPNAPKRYTNTGYTAGEDCTIEFFKQINDQIKMIYPPGLRFHTLADTSLYASAFQTQQIEVDAYFESLKERIKELNADDCVFIYDYADLLRTTCRDKYLDLYYKFSPKVWSGDIQSLLPEGRTYPCIKFTGRYRRICWKRSILRLKIWRERFDTCSWRRRKKI